MTGARLCRRKVRRPSGVLQKMTMLVDLGLPSLGSFLVWGLEPI